jgi:hypothetical protein
MAYKSNREARAEYLAIEQKNRERNWTTHEHRKRKKRGVNWLVIIVVLLIALFLMKRQSGLWPPGRPPFTPAGHSR